MARPSLVGVWAAHFSSALAGPSQMAPVAVVASWALSRLRCVVQPLGLPAMVAVAAVMDPISVVVALLVEAVALFRRPGPNKDPQLHAATCVAGHAAESSKAA